MCRCKNFGGTIFSLNLEREREREKRKAGNRNTWCPKGLCRIHLLISDRRHLPQASAKPPCEFSAVSCLFACLIFCLLFCCILFLLRWAAHLHIFQLCTNNFCRTYYIYKKFRSHARVFGYVVMLFSVAVGKLSLHKVTYWWGYHFSASSTWERRSSYTISKKNDPVTKYISREVAKTFW